LKRLQRSNDCSLKTFFYSLCDKFKINVINSEIPKTQKYICLTKTGEYDVVRGVNSDILDFNAFKIKSNSILESNSIIQEYIYSSFDKVVLYRLWYYLNNSEGKVELI